MRHYRILHRVVPRVVLVGLMLLASVWPGGTARAHEIPRHVGVRAYVAPLSDRVRLLVQIPMNAVRDVEFPLRANGAFDVARVSPFLRDAAQLWVADAVRVRDGRRVLAAPQVVAVRAALPSDHAFGGYATALQAIQQQPLADDVDIPHGQLNLEVVLEVPIGTPVSDLIIEPTWANLGVQTTTVMTLVNTNGTTRQYAFDGNPDAVRLDPRWWHAAMLFVQEGVGHMLGGLDHLLFLLCLVLPFRQLRPLIGVVTAFTVAHSITLGASALGYAPDVGWFPPLIEVLIAASIVYMALENILGARLERRWYLAFAFGLVHGFGFSAALGDTLQFAGTHLLMSLLAFNLGVELAQIAVLLLLIPVLDRVLTHMVPERLGLVIASAVVAHEAWHWMFTRVAELRAYPFTMPVPDRALAATVVPMLMVLLLLIGVAWGMAALFTRWRLHESSAVGAGSSPSALSKTTQGVARLLMAGAVFSALAVPVRAHAQPARSTMAGVYTASQATKGREVFNSNCLGCHTTASHQGTAFQLKWFGRPLFDLYDYLSQAMPKAAPGSLTEDEYVWVTAYILRLNGMPPGKAELSAEPSLLKAVRVDSTTTRGVGASEQDAGRTMQQRTR